MLCSAIFSASQHLSSIFPKRSQMSGFPDNKLNIHKYYFKKTRAFWRLMKEKI